MGTVVSKEEDEKNKVTINLESSDRGDSKSYYTSSNSKNTDKNSKPLSRSAMKSKSTKASLELNDDYEQEQKRSPDGTVKREVDITNVKVNLNFHDLMVYLDAVAKNSQNLPITIRDDPDLDRSVSTLSAEQYAQKCEAFVRADIRVIGGTFTKYGRVWNLPTSEEFVLSDGAQEPGLSYGGCICNSFLKVVNDKTNKKSIENNYILSRSRSLFDDEDEGINEFVEDKEETKTEPECSPSPVTPPSEISWLDLLKSMEGHIKELGYPQYPTFTSSRKFDLRDSVSLLPKKFDVHMNKKRALLVGCNYLDIPGAKLTAAHDDILLMKAFLCNMHGFTDDEVTILLDDNIHDPPTYANIVEKLQEIAVDSQPGDAVFVQFSGHGCRILDVPLNSDTEGYDEAIVPCDFSDKGLIRDTLLFKTFLVPMREGITVTCIFDACDKGFMFDLPYSWSNKKDRSPGITVTTVNQNFSFLRFLKITKSLFDTSDFIRIGSSMVEALSNSEQNKYRYGDDDGDDDDDDDERSHGESTAGSLVSAERDSVRNSSFMDTILSACHNPPINKSPIRQDTMCGITSSYINGEDNEISNSDGHDK